MEFPAKRIPSLKSYAELTISTAADGLSPVLDLGGHDIRSYCMSTDWTAASMTFRGSHRSTDLMYDIYTSTGGELTHTVAANQLITFVAQFEGLRYIQFRSGTAALPVAQAAARTLCIGLSAPQIK